SSNVAVHPSPVDDCTSKPTSGSIESPSEKWRISSQRSDSVDAWNANDEPSLAIRNLTLWPSTANELQSSDTPRVTTLTTMGFRSGESSKHSFAQLRSSAC